METPAMTSPARRARSLSQSDRSPGPRVTIHKDTFSHVGSRLMEGLTGAASHGQGAARMSTALCPIPSTESSAPAPPRINNNAMRASISSETGRDVVLEGKRKQVFEDVQEVREVLCFYGRLPTYHLAILCETNSRDLRTILVQGCHL